MLGPMDAAWVIPCLTGAHIVGVNRENPLMMKATHERMEDVSLFYSSNLPLTEKVNLLKKYHVTYILLKNKKNNPEIDVSHFADQINENHKFILFKVSQRKLNSFFESNSD